MNKGIKIIFGVSIFFAAGFILAVSDGVHHVLAEGNPGLAAQTTTEPGEETLPPDFDWAAFTRFEARLMQCEEIAQKAWETGKTIQVQRCIGPSPFTYLENPNVESIPQVEDAPQPANIQPAIIEAAPNQ